MRNKSSSRLLFSLFAILLLFGGFFVSDAYAYLDPGTGSIVIQAIIGALAGVGITIKVYWEKIKSKFSSMRMKSNDE